MPVAISKFKEERQNSTSQNCKNISYYSIVINERKKNNVIRK